MMVAKFTTGPLRVLIDGTMTGVWPHIVQECVDPKTKELWNRELGEVAVCYERRDDAYPQHGSTFRPYDEAPDQFQPTPECEEAIANAQLWATAPRLYSALADAIEFMESVDPTSLTLAEARGALADATDVASAKVVADVDA